MSGCLFCGALETGADHYRTCDGRQGAIEAAMVDPFRFVRARRTDPETSVEAALANRNTDRARAYQALREHPAGLTDFELAEVIDRQQTSAGKRRGELRDLGLVCDSGLRRDAPSGSAAIVWRITTAAERLQRAG